MKLRGNKLRPLRFDPSGAFIETGGIDHSAVLQLAKELESFRDSIVQDEQILSINDLTDEGSGDSFDIAFYSMPRRLLLEYEQDRHGCELARLFRVANRMHASVDRVVVLGMEGSDLGAKTFLDGCCQPFWNELSRGARGSKPRMYFHVNNLDNDSTQGLLSLLGAYEDRVSTSEQDSWGLVVIGESDENLETSPTHVPFLRALDKSCGGDSEKIRQRLMAVTGTAGKLRRMMDELGCPDIFPFPDFAQGNIRAGFGVLSAVGLVPAALMGVNVIELLLGAVAMNSHFEKTPAEENIVLQFVAVNYLLATQRKKNVRVVSVWSQALESVGLWYQNLVQGHLAEATFGGTTTVKRNGVSSHLVARDYQRLGCDRIYHDFQVDEHHFDVIDGLVGLSRLEENEVARARQSQGFPTTRLLIPRLDELHLGQLLQMLLVATTVENRLLRHKYGKAACFQAPSLGG